MDWKRIKTIFIVTFLILNIFLLQQLLDEQKDNELKQIVSESTVEKLDEIHYETKIPEYEEKYSLISTTNKRMTAEDYAVLEDRLTIEKVGSSSSLVLKEPFPIEFTTPEEIEAQLNAFVANFVLYGEEYRLWGISEDKRKIVFQQTYDNNSIYFDIDELETTPTGLIEITVDEDGQITKYNQTYLIISQQGNEQKILSFEEALDNLFRNRYVRQDSVVSKIELCYFSLIAIENTQVFSPTWYIQINERSYMVNAIDGTITEYNETE